MGSFTDGRLSFFFREDTPDEVLAAFSALAEVSLETDPQPPPLPTPVIEVDEMWAPDYAEMMDGEADPHAAEPWKHDWAPWMSEDMAGDGSRSSATLSWDRHRARWRLQCEFTWKTGAQTVCEAIEWLAPFVEPRKQGTPQLIGEVHDDHDPRPKLMWSHNERIFLENLDPYRTGSQEALDLKSAELIVVAGLPGAGKTHLLQELAAEHPDWLICDNFQTGAVERDNHPTASRYFGGVVRALQKGRTVVIADVNFGHEGPLYWTLAEILRQAPFSVYRLICFENDVPACEHNIRADEQLGVDRNHEVRRERLQNWGAWIESSPVEPNRPVTRVDLETEQGR